MKKIFLIIFILILVLFAGIFLYEKYFDTSYLPPQDIVHEQIKKQMAIQANYTPEKDIQEFMDGHVSGIKQQGSDQNNALQGGEVVDHYTDSQGRLYDVQQSTNRVVKYFSQTEKVDRTEPVITFQQAQEKAKQIMKKNMPGFDTFAKTATYLPEQERAAGLYIINWVGKKELTNVQQAYFQEKGIEPPQYHMQVVLDKYGNLRNFDNEFLGNG